MKQGYGRDQTSYNKYYDCFAFQPMTYQKCDSTLNTNNLMNLCTKNISPAEKGLKKYSVVIYN